MNKIVKKTLISFIFSASLFALSRNLIVTKQEIRAKAATYSSGAAYYADNRDNLYYQGIDDSLVGEELISALSTLTSTGFVSYSYSSLPSIYQYADLTSSGNMRLVYTGTQKNFSAGSMPAGTNKEHVWPASWYGNGNRTEGSGTPGADAHNVWPSATFLNSKRGTSSFDELDFNKYYKAGEFSQSDFSYGTSGDNDSFVWSTRSGNSNGQPDDILYPSKGNRGSTARTLMYVATRYRNDSRFPVMIHDEPVTEKIGRIGKLSTLLKWHFEEPPTDFEIKRNNEVAARWHHNRNPFVDNPDFASRIYYYLPEPDMSQPTQAVMDVIETYGAPNTKIRLSHTTASLKVNETLQVSVTANPNNETVVWSSSDPTIVSVANGLLTAKKEGNATISAVGSETSATVRVSVVPDTPDVLVQSITASPTNLSLQVGEEKTITTTILPVDATNKSVETVSSNTNIARINNNKISGLSVGETTIKIRSTDGTNIETVVNVKVTPYAPMDGEGWTLIHDVSDLKVGSQLVIASNTKDAVAGNLSNSVLTSVEYKFNGETKKISGLPTSATIFTLGGTTDSYTLTNSDGQILGVNAEKTLSYTTGTNTWKINVVGGRATIETTNAAYGTLQYNNSAPRFTTYKSSQTAINLYTYIDQQDESALTTAINFAANFLSVIDENQAVNETVWNDIAALYSGLNDGVKDFIINNYETNFVLSAFVEIYETVITNSNITNFLVDSHDLPLFEQTIDPDPVDPDPVDPDPTSEDGEGEGNDNNIGKVVAVTSGSVVGAGGIATGLFFILRKRRTII